MRMLTCNLCLQSTAYDSNGMPAATAQAVLELFLLHDVEFEYMDPAIVFRKELMQHSRYHVRDPHGNVTGVQLPCPWCHSNKHVRISGFNKQHCRAYHTLSGVRVTITALYTCTNDKCKGPPSKSGKGVAGAGEGEDSDVEMPTASDGAASKAHQFSPHLDEYLRFLPREVRGRFQSVHCSSRAGYAVELARFVLDTYDHPISHQQRVLEALAKGRECQGRLRYEAFIQRMGGTVATASFAPWQTFEDGGCLAPPSEKTLRTVFNQAYNRIHPYLQQDLQRRPVGICLSGDGTHRIGGRTIGDTVAVHFVMNEDSYVVAYGAADCDDIGPMIPLYMGLRDRAEREGALCGVRAVYLDTCCQNRKDIGDTPMAYIFPSVEQVNGDGYHLCNRITRTAHVHHPAFREFAAEVGHAVRVPYIPDHAVVAQALLSNPPKGRRKRQPCTTMAQAEALAWSAAYKSSIRTQALPASTIAANLRELRRK
jgi:hypothetical protein